MQASAVEESGTSTCKKSISTHSSGTLLLERTDGRVKTMKPQCRSAQSFGGMERDCHVDLMGDRVDAMKETMSSRME